jgi:FkbM family methyltransferase
VYHSQYGQDKFIHERFFKDSPAGFFIEVGALDGILHSNTLFFERELGWKGVLVEPNPALAGMLEQNRPRCRVENVALTDRDGSMPFTQIIGDFYGWSGLADNMAQKHIDRINRLIPNTSVKEVDVPTKSAQTLLEQLGVRKIDLMSIDTEGSEAVILSAFPWEDASVSVFCIEKNDGQAVVERILREHGYAKVEEIGSDAIYARSDLL